MAATTDPATATRQISCLVNGESVQVELPDDDGLTLLDVLRDTHAANAAIDLAIRTLKSALH